MAVPLHLNLCCAAPYSSKPVHANGTCTGIRLSLILKDFGSPLEPVKLLKRLIRDNLGSWRSTAELLPPSGFRVSLLHGRHNRTWTKSSALTTKENEVLEENHRIRFPSPTFVSFVVDELSPLSADCLGLSW